MSNAIPGHGFGAAFTIRPSCKCGWLGNRVGPGPYDAVYSIAHQRFEAHKDSVRRQGGNHQPSTTKRRTTSKAIGRKLRLVK